MPKKKILFLVLLAFGFFLAETFYLPSKNKTFQLIQESIEDVRTKSLQKKEENFIKSYGFDDYLNYSIAYSKVLFRDIYHMNQEITIYKGRDEGIKKNYLVVNENGLIGIINTVDKHTSRVQLLTNEAIQLSVKINSSYGVLKCQNHTLIVEGIHNMAEIHVGDEVRTSDLSIYPEDILVGTVKDITYDRYEIEQVLTISPSVSLDSISYLGIITNLRGEQ